MKTKRNCRKTCQAGMLEHAIKLAQIQLERVAVRICRTHKCHPDIGLGEDYTDICEVIDDLETDVQVARSVHDGEYIFIELEHNLEHNYEHNETFPFEKKTTRRRAS